MSPGWIGDDPSPARLIAIVFGATNCAVFGAMPPTSTNVALENVTCDGSNVTLNVINPTSGPVPLLA